MHPAEVEELDRQRHPECIRPSGMQVAGTLSWGIATGVAGVEDPETSWDTEAEDDRKKSSSQTY